MANGEAPVGGSPLDAGASPEAGKAVGNLSINSRASIDSSAFKELNKEFKALNAHVTQFKQDLPKLIEDTKKWASELGKVAKQLKAVGQAQGGGQGGGYLPAAGSLTGGGGTTVSSGNVSNVTQISNVFMGGGPGGGQGGGFGDDQGGGKKGKAGAYLDMAGQLLQGLDSRIARGAEYSLSADRMNMLYQQMYGMSQNQTYHAFRAPLQQYKLGMGGINELLNLQATTGLNAQQQAGSIEAMRAASGFAYSTQQIAGMTAAMATPEASNQMFMMLGTGMYGIGGKQRTQQEVFQDAIKRLNLTDEGVLKGAFQQGSMTRTRLAMSGFSEDQQNLLLQYAQQQTAFQKKGGQGFYDPSKKEDREFMGVENNYATQAEETERVKANREENFYKRQADNFATFEKGLQKVTKALGMLEETLSPLIGARTSTKSITSVLSKVGGFAMSAFGVATANPALIAGGMAVSQLGDATVRPSQRSLKRSGDASAGDGKKKISPENERKLKQLDSQLAVPLRKMLEENDRLTIGSAKRSKDVQEREFKRRYKPRPDLKQKTKDADRIWNGVVWEFVATDGSVAMAPPGMSWHEHGMAADVHGDDQWIIKNASRFGLGHGGTGTGGPDDEPFHIQPAATMGKYPPSDGNVAGIAPIPENLGEGGASGSSSGTKANVATSRASTTGISSAMGPIDFSFSGMSMGEVVGTGSVYASPSSSSSSAKSPSGAKSITKGGDATINAGGRGVSGASSYNITVSPNFTIHSTGSANMDWQKIAKEVASLLEQEVQLTMMRSA